MLRGRLILSGIADPLRMLPDLHAVLDVAEILWTEHMDSEQLEQYNRDMYRPDTIDKTSGELIVAPAGFDAEDEMAGFDAFEKMAGGG